MIDLTRESPLSAQEAADFAGVTRKTIDRWFSKGLERCKLGGRVYTSREALQRFAVHDTPQEMGKQRTGYTPDEIADAEKIVALMLGKVG